MGTVGNDETSTIKCSCPVEFVSIEYDTPQADWVLDLDSSSAVLMDQITVTNTCNPAIVSQCSDLTQSSTQSTTVKSVHNWGYVFKAGVSYTAGASAEFMGFGASESITVSAEVSQSNGGSYEKDQTVTSTETCIARPMTQETCQYIAYKGTIEVGYTIYWKNASPTRGTYKGQGWKSVLSSTTQQL